MNIFGICETALHAACWKGHDNCVQLLLDAGADVDLKKSRRKGQSSLSLACAGGHLECARILYEAGAGFAEENLRYGEYVLHGPSRCGHTECVRLLIRAGASLDLENEEEETALYLACEGEHLECAKLLVDAGADLLPFTMDECSWRDCDPMHAAIKNENVACVKMLLEAYTRAGLGAGDEETSFSYACYIGSATMLQLLIDNGANFYEAYV